MVKYQIFCNCNLGKRFEASEITFGIARKNYGSIFKVLYDQRKISKTCIPFLEKRQVDVSTLIIYPYIDR